MLLGDARPCILDSKLDAGADGQRAYTNCRANPRILYGVIDEIRQDMLDGASVCLDPRRRIRNIDGQALPALVGALPEQLHHLGD